MGLILLALATLEEWRTRETARSSKILERSPRGEKASQNNPGQVSTIYSLDARTLSLTLPADLRGGGHRLVLRTRGVLRFSGTPKTLDLRYDRLKKRWYAHQVVEAPEPERKAKPERYAALDFGARVLAALAIEGLSRQILFSGRKVWKDFLYWTKLIAEEQSRLVLSGRKTSRRLRRLYQVRARRLRHAFVALSAEIARILKRHHVTALFLEDLTGIREEMDFGPNNLLVHNFWAFRMLNSLIKAACTRFGIKIVFVEPRGTSSRCADCGSSISRFVRHKAACRRCGCVWHARRGAQHLAFGLLEGARGGGHALEAARSLVGPPPVGRPHCCW